jgi:GNAT superfamily N-acetyltransferase
MSVALRPATPADAEPLARGMVEGMDVYRSFAPEGWSPPPLEPEVEHTRELLGDDRVWTLVAESGGQVVGQITILPAAIAGRPVDDPQLAHVRNLFVRQDHWGTGLARTLHDAALDEARRRGFTAGRLIVAAGYGRARRFYEREGWAAYGEEVFDPVPGLVILEYRRQLQPEP